MTTTTTKLLGREPTNEMLIAAREWSRAKFGKPIGDAAAIECFQVQFDAAPEQTESAAQEAAVTGKSAAANDACFKRVDDPKHRPPPAPADPIHKRVFEYDGAYKCLDCGAKWGALPGKPTMPTQCKRPVTPDTLPQLAKAIFWCAGPDGRHVDKIEYDTLRQAAERLQARARELERGIKELQELVAELENEITK